MIPLAWRLAAAGLALAALLVLYHWHVSTLQAAAREAGRKEAINAIAAQDDKFVAALRAAFARRSDCLRNGGMRWEQSSGECVRR